MSPSPCTITDVESRVGQRFELHRLALVPLERFERHADHHPIQREMLNSDGRDDIREREQTLVVQPALAIGRAFPR